MPTKVYLVVPFAALILLMIFGATQRSIWYDEAITMQTLAADQFVMPPAGFMILGDIGKFFDGTTNSSELVRRYAETDVHPPLYFLVLHFAGLVFGGGLMVARGVSIVCVTLSICLYWWALGRVCIVNRGIYVAVFALSFASVSSAQDARGYALVLLCATAAWSLSALADMAHKTSAKIKLEAGVGLACAAVLYTHYFSLFVVVPILGWRILHAIVQRQFYPLIGPVLCALLFAPWVPIVMDQMTTRPGQMSGFTDVIEWLRGASNFVPAQVFSIAWPDVPELIQVFGRDIVLLLVIVGALTCIGSWRRNDAPQAFSRLALWVPAVGMTTFLAASIFMDRWFMTFRYFLFFAPFLSFLAAHGALMAGTALHRATSGKRSGLKMTPSAILIAAQVAALNFGWEAIGTRGGNYFLTMGDHIDAAGPSNSLLIIDGGTGRGTMLAAAYALPPTTPTYLLDPDPNNWANATTQIETGGQSMVVLVYSIERVTMGSDKTEIYHPILEALSVAGYTSVSTPPSDRGGRYYAKWVRTNATD